MHYNCFWSTSLVLQTLSMLPGLLGLPGSLACPSTSRMELVVLGGAKWQHSSFHNWGPGIE